MALISKGIKLYWKAEGMQGPTPYVSKVLEQHTHETYGWEMIGLQEIGELSEFGGGLSRDKIEITTLADDRHVYTEGLIAESDMAGISFKFLFDADLFSWFKANQEFIETAVNSEGELYTREGMGHWYVVLPDGTYFKMFATITDAKVDGAGVGAALTMTLTLTPFKALECKAASFQ